MIQKKTYFTFKNTLDFAIKIHKFDNILGEANAFHLPSGVAGGGVGEEEEVVKFRKFLVLNPFFCKKRADPLNFRCSHFPVW